jgi:molybdate transport system ATP-binding protein
MIEINIEKILHSASGEMQLDVQLEIKNGEMVTLFGASGAGKTSILRILSGLMRADRSKIKVNDIVWDDSGKRIHLPPQARNTGFVFQDYALFPNMSVEENLQYAVPRNKDPKIVQELLEMMELGQLAPKNIGFLSGGQKQRVAIARALASSPKLLLLDEPLAALDHELRVGLQEQILRIHRFYKITTILVSHDLAEIFRMSDKVYFLEEGKIKKSGSPDEVFNPGNMQGKFQITGKIVSILRSEIQIVILVMTGGSMMKIRLDEKEAEGLCEGDLVMIASEEFKPIIHKLDHI